MTRPLNPVLALPLALIVALAGCSMDLGEAPFYCCAGTDCSPQCPSGYTCKSNYCIKKDSCPDYVPGCGTESACNFDDVCGEDETPESCPEDCHADRCPDEVCQPTENCATCSQDCGSCLPECGNEECEEGETSRDCPADCPAEKCQAGQTQCEGNETLQTCREGSWEKTSCDSLCSQGPYDYAVGCVYDELSQRDLCQCEDYGTIGTLCGGGKICAPSLVCGRFDPSKSGFCTAYCDPSGAPCPPGPSATSASCSLDIEGETACGFQCQNPNDCPPGMACGATDQYCKPSR